MSTLRLKINPYRNVNSATLDNRPLSAYSEISNFLKEPFLKWACHLMSSIENDINDDYDLVVMGERFETLFLEDMQNDEDSCLSFTPVPFPLNTSVKERFDLAVKLAERYGISYEFSSYYQPVYSDLPIPFEKYDFQPAEAENASIYITKDANAAYSRICGSSGMTILISSENCVSYSERTGYIWEITEDRLDTILTSMSDRFVKVPYIVDVIEALEKRRDLSPDDAATAAFALEIESVVKISAVPNMEVGQSYDLRAEIIPMGADLPELRTHSSNQAVLTADGIHLEAKSAGQATIEVYRADEIIPFFKQSVHVSQNHDVVKIGLSGPETIGEGTRTQLGISPVPADADDIASITWNVSDPGIAQIDEKGVIKGLREGVVTVTVSARRVSETARIHVLPAIKEIRFSSEFFEMYIGEKKPVDVFVFPSNSFDKRYEWISSNPAVAEVVRMEDGRSAVCAKGIGACSISCCAVSGPCRKTMDVQVKSTFEKKEYNHSWLSWTFAAVVLTLILAVLSVPVVPVLGAIATIILGVMAITKNRTDVFWSILLMLAAVVIAVLSF